MSSALAHPRPQPVTAYEIGEQSAHKPLGRFGSKSVHKVVAEARAEAERTELQLHRRRQDLRPGGAVG